MKTLASGFALVLGAAFMSIGVASPAHADRCSAKGLFPGSATWQQCENDNPLIASNDDGTPVCQRSTSTTGASDCPACQAAISNPDLRLQVAFDCGAQGGANTMGGQQPHCKVGGFPTGRLKPKCYGDLQEDGSVNATS
jgi:hypothetical protein